MRTIGAGRALSGLLAITLVLMAGCIALGYLIAQGSTIEPGLAAKAAAGNVFDAKRTEGRAVIDRIGDLSGRLIRLEIEAAALARRLGVAPSTANIEPGSAKPAVDDRPRGGPLLPLGNTAPMTGAAAHSIAGEPGSSLGYLETEIALLEASLDRMAGLLDDRDLAHFLGECLTAAGNATDDDDLLALLTGNDGTSICWQSLPLQRIAAVDVPKRFKFEPHPQAAG